MINDILRDDGQVMISAMKDPAGITSPELTEVFQKVEDIKENDLILDATFSFPHQLSYRNVLHKLAIIVRELWGADGRCMETPYLKLPAKVRFSDEALRYIKAKAHRIASGEESQMEERVGYAKFMVKLIEEIEKYNEEDLKAHYNRIEDYPALTELPRTEYEKKVDEFLQGV